MRLAILELKVAVIKVLSAFRIEATSETPKPVSLPDNCSISFFWNHNNLINVIKDEKLGSTLDNISLHLIPVYFIIKHVC